MAEGGLASLPGLKDRSPEEWRERFVKAVSFSRAVEVLAGANHIEVSEDDLDFLRRDAEAGVHRAVRGCVRAAKTPEELRREAE
jgi:hypothetical protein